MSTTEEQTESEANNELLKSNVDWLQVALRIPVAFALHPFEYTKILIQLGHEPILPRPSHTFFGRPVLALPNIFEYFGHVRRNVGILYMYRGVVPRMLGIFTHSLVHREVSKKVSSLLNSSDNEGEEVSETEQDPNIQQDRVLQFFLTTMRYMLSQGVAVIVSHPFQVVTVRMVAQYIGGEEAYNWMLSSIREIYRESGIFGFYSGLAPRLLGEMLAFWICSSLTFVFNNYLLKDKELKTYTGAVMSLISSTVTYPYVLVARIMMVNGSEMRIAFPPHSPVYTGWTDCWQQLKAHNQLKRGSSILWRYYTGPVGLKDGKQYPISYNNLKKPYASKY